MQNKSAKEMFEELGYKKIELLNSKNIIFETKNERIIFGLYNKIQIAKVEIDEMGKAKNDTWINTKEIKAITQQLKELENAKK